MKQIGSFFLHYLETASYWVDKLKRAIFTRGCNHTMFGMLKCAKAAVTLEIFAHKGLKVFLTITKIFKFKFQIKINERTSHRDHFHVSKKAFMTVVRTLNNIFPYLKTKDMLISLLEILFLCGSTQKPYTHCNVENCGSQWLMASNGMYIMDRSE